MDRLDKILLVRYPDFSRSRIEGLIKAGFVTVNQVVAEKAGQKVTETDQIEVTIPPPVPAIPEPEAIPLDIIYEDEDLIAINKCPGMVVHPAPGHFTGTLVNALLAHCPSLSGIGGVARPGIVHRLDQDTSGVIVVAKSQRAMDSLTRAFSEHRNLQKTYLAICRGAPRVLSGRIETLIGRHPVDRKKMAIVDKNGKNAITNWRVLAVKGPCSLIQCEIETGRTHQIRVHMASIGCPVAGDAVYGRSSEDRRLKPPPPRQLLHAFRLKLVHPVSRAPLTLEAPIPEDLKPYFNFQELGL